jgi:hypothetical protein
MYEVKATSGQYAGQWVVAESIEKAIDEFGQDIDRSTFRLVKPKIVEFVPVGCDVVQVMDDGGEVYVTTAADQESAETLAGRFNASRL